MKRRGANLSIFGSFLFFALIAIVVTVAMFIFGYVNEKTDGDRTVIAVVMLLVILFLSLLCTIVDLIRRRKTVDKPVEQILDATERIAAGDFSVRLPIMREYGKYNQYDCIMDNLNTMAEALRKSEVLKTDFISDVSHELKTPLTVIHSYATLLREEKDEQKREKYTVAVAEAASRLSVLIGNILQLNKLENQSVLPEKTVVKLDEKLAEVILTFEERIERKKVELICDLQENIRVFTVESYLEIIFNNLVSNAVKFTNEGGRVEVKLKKEDENVVVTVRDTGVGISPEVGARIFDKFYQGDASHAKEGNGLGLALVKRAIDVLGGEISVQSKLGEGSTFTVKLKEVATAEVG